MLADQLKECGVVGAGGAGYPTFVKAQAQVEYMIANGAECEPLLHKDFEIMKQFPAQIVGGMRRMMEATRAREGKFGIKSKNKEAIHAIGPHAQENGIDLVFLGDFYPSGDEYELVYEATRRLIPAAGIPLKVDCVVSNVETLFNVYQAAQNIPVTRKFVSISGAVNRPCSFWAPLGSTFRDLLDQAGGAACEEFGIFVSGIMMGSLTFDLEGLVTKTTCGLIVLPKDHSLVVRKSRPQAIMNQIGKSACDQCSYCTEFCPRYLLGYEVQPHKVMRSLGFTSSGSNFWNQWGELCCACGLCTLYACPEDLYPKEACDQAKRDLRAAGIKFTQTKEVRVHPMKEYRRVPLLMLRKRLNVEQYESETPFVDRALEPSRVRIKLQQHVGKKAQSVVRKGDTVEVGTVLGRVSGEDLGANIHSSIRGEVVEVSDDIVEVRA